MFQIIHLNNNNQIMKKIKMFKTKMTIKIS